MVESQPTYKMLETEILKSVCYMDIVELAEESPIEKLSKNVVREQDIAMERNNIEPS